MSFQLPLLVRGTTQDNPEECPEMQKVMPLATAQLSCDVCFYIARGSFNTNPETVSQTADGNPALRTKTHGVHQPDYSLNIESVIVYHVFCLQLLCKLCS